VMNGSNNNKENTQLVEDLSSRVETCTTALVGLHHSIVVSAEKINKIKPTLDYQVAVMRAWVSLLQAGKTLNNETL